MLTGDLVRVRNTKGGLKCGFVAPDDAKLIERAETMLAAFHTHVGQTRSDLDAALLDIEGDGIDHKLTRGLAKVCLDRSDFGTREGLDPFTLRQQVFALVARTGPLALNLPDALAAPQAHTASALWTDLADQLQTPALTLQNALYADLPSEQVLGSCDLPSATWLLHRYNLALVQAVLLKARRLTLTLPSPSAGEARAVFRALKFHQLIAEIAPEDYGYTVQIDGPASVLTQSTRYGMSLAKFFPVIPLLRSPWDVHADVVWSGRSTGLKLDQTLGLVSHYRETGTWRSREAEWFTERWPTLNTAWTLNEGGLPVRQGSEAVVIPDFTLRNGEKTVYIELLGFWRAGVLQKRLDLLRRYGPANLLVLASKKLLSGQAIELPPNVITFAETIPTNKVLKWVESSG